MYVRGAKKREEVWLLDNIEAMGLADPAFRSRDYVVALDEETGEKAGFGRIRIHKDGEPACELTTVGVLDEHRDAGVGAHITERLVEIARDQGFDVVYTLTDVGGYFAQFGFSAVGRDDLPPVLRERFDRVRERNPEAVPMALPVDSFEMPRRLRERFKLAGDHEADKTPDDGERPEDFGIDPETATYKYDTGRR